MSQAPRCLPLLALLLAAACSKSNKSQAQDQPPSKQESQKPEPPKPEPPKPAPRTDEDPAVSWYRVECKYDDYGSFEFAIGVRTDRPEGWIVSGPERLPLIVESRDPLVLRVPVRGAYLSFDKAKPGEPLHGKWLVKFYYKRDLDITATPIARPDRALVFPGTEKPEADLTGTWKIDVQEFGVGRAMFQQKPDGSIDGTLIPPEIGDLRTLSGRVVGNTARLTAFDGIHGFLVELHIKDKGTSLIGDWMIGGIGDFQVTATRSDQLPDTHLKTSAHMAPGKTKLTLPGLEAPPYAGKPVIVDYFGSWCPECIDLTPELVRIHKEHEADGLQIMSIALEPSSDRSDSKRRLDEFRAAFGVTWPFTVRYVDDFVGSVPPEVKDATGFPVTIFLRRDHTVAAIHTGFVSVAAKTEHDALVKWLDQAAAEIVAK